VTYPDRLTAFVVDAVEALERTHLPGFRLPGVFAGHEVGTDARADLVFTLGLLADCGVDAIAGRPLDDALRTVLAGVDGRRTNTFFSYRIAETLRRRPHLLAEAAPARRQELVLACDSTAFLPAMADGRLPRNYAAVLLRCEVDRDRLGLGPDPDVLGDLTDRVRSLLGTNPKGYLDDSHTAIARYDIYSGDIYLFTYWQPVRGRSLLDEAGAIANEVSHVHVFHWTDTGERRPLAEGSRWPALLVTLDGPTRWTAERFAFLEFVRDDDPQQVLADAATLRDWL
jgi:hypothetical protein